MDAADNSFIVPMFDLSGWNVNLFTFKQIPKHFILFQKVKTVFNKYKHKNTKFNSNYFASFTPDVQKDHETAHNARPATRNIKK